MMRLPVFIAGVLSIGLHLAFLLLLPAPSWQAISSETPPRDVEIVHAELPEPQALRPPPPELQPAPQPPPPPPLVPTYDASKIAQLDVEQIDGAIEHVSAGASLQLSMPELTMPVREAPETVTESLPLPAPDTAEVVASLLEPSSLPPGLPQGKEKPVGLGQLRLGNKQSPSRWEWPKPEPASIAPPLPEFEPVPPGAPPQTLSGIQGPVAKREPLSQPSLPEVVVESESEITLKFWVRPDGIVSRVLTIRKGDAALEAAATRYIEGWRFNPLPPNEEQQEQWGTITVRFLLPTR